MALLLIPSKRDTSMDLHLLDSAAVAVFIVMLSTTTPASGEGCTSGFVDSINVEDYDVQRLVPLLGRRGSYGAERWVFRDLQFTCRGRLTGWRFRAAPKQGASTPPECRINIGIWRLSRNSYRRLRIMKRPHSTNNGSLYLYELDSPVRVKPGDIMGIELNSYECSSVDNILSHDLSGTESSSLSFKTGTTLFIGQNSMTSTTQHSNLIPLIQPIVDTVIVAEEPIKVITDTNLAEDKMTTAAVTDPLTSSVTDSEGIDGTTSDTLSTTTDSSFVQTNEPRNAKRFLIIHVVAGLGLALIILSGVVVTCITVVCIMRCVQARTVVKLRRRFDREQAEAVNSNSIGMLLQENAAYRRMTVNEYSYPGDATGYETMPSRQEWKFDTRQPVGNFDSNQIVVQGNTAYCKSAHSAGMAVYDTTLTNDKQTCKSAQSTKELNSDGIVVHANTAYTKSSRGRDIVGYETTSSTERGKSDSDVKLKNNGDTDVESYETIDEMVGQLMPSNLAHGFQGESHGGDMNAGDYETMTDNPARDNSNHSFIKLWPSQ